MNHLVAEQTPQAAQSVVSTDAKPAATSGQRLAEQKLVQVMTPEQVAALKAQNTSEQRVGLLRESPREPEDGDPSREAQLEYIDGLFDQLKSLTDDLDDILEKGGLQSKDVQSPIENTPVFQIDFDSLVNQIESGGIDALQQNFGLAVKEEYKQAIQNKIAVLKQQLIDAFDKDPTLYRSMVERANQESQIRHQVREIFKLGRFVTEMMKIVQQLKTESFKLSEPSKVIINEKIEGIKKGVSSAKKRMDELRSDDEVETRYQRIIQDKLDRDEARVRAQIASIPEPLTPSNGEMTELPPDEAQFYQQEVELTKQDKMVEAKRLMGENFYGIDAILNLNKQLNLLGIDLQFPVDQSAVEDIPFSVDLLEKLRFKYVLVYYPELPQLSDQMKALLADKVKTEQLKKTSPQAAAALSLFEAFQIDGINLADQQTAKNNPNYKSGWKLVEKDQLARLGNLNQTEQAQANDRLRVALGDNITVQLASASEAAMRLNLQYAQRGELLPGYAMTSSKRNEDPSQPNNVKTVIVGWGNHPTQAQLDIIGIDPDFKNSNIGAETVIQTR